MSYSPYAHAPATTGRLGLIKASTGISIAADGTVTTSSVPNGVVTNGSYSDPTWLTISATKVGLGNVTNESKATMFTNPAFTGTPTGITKTHVGLGSVDNTADSAKSVNYATTSRRLARSDSAVDTYNVQSWWDGTYWELKGYNDTTYHAGVKVAYSTSAGSAPASDVYAWAKQSTKPSYTNSEVGLGSVGNYSVNQDVATSSSPTFNTVYANNFLYQSDAALKNNIENITGSWNIIDQLRPVSFDWKNNGKSDYGFVAQELQEVLPNSVGSDGHSLGITPSAIIAHLVAAVKDLKSQVETLTKRLGE